MGSDSHPAEKEFNCVQRAHQNTLESWAPVQILMFAAGIMYAEIAATCGFVWAIGRIVYGYGYANYGPSGRHYGTLPSRLAELVLLAAGFGVAYRMITSSPEEISRSAHADAQTLLF